MAGTAGNGYGTFNIYPADSANKVNGDVQKAYLNCNNSGGYGNSGSHSRNRFWENASPGEAVSQYLSYQSRNVK